MARTAVFQGRNLKLSLRRSSIYLAAIFATHVAAMAAFEGMATQDALWLTLTTVTAGGYGDLSAATPLGRATTVVLLYIGGIFVAAKFAGDYFEYRSAYVDRGEGHLRTNPAAGDGVDAVALIVMVRADNIPRLDDVRNALKL